MVSEIRVAERIDIYIDGKGSNPSSKKFRGCPKVGSITASGILSFGTSHCHPVVLHGYPLIALACQTEPPDQPQVSQWNCFRILTAYSLMSKFYFSQHIITWEQANAKLKIRTSQVKALPAGKWRALQRHWVAWAAGNNGSNYIATKSTDMVLIFSRVSDIGEMRW